MLHLEQLQIFCLIVSLTVNFYVALYLRLFVCMCACVCISAFVRVCILKAGRKSYVFTVVILMNEVVKHGAMPQMYTMPVHFSETED